MKIAHFQPLDKLGLCLVKAETWTVGPQLSSTSAKPSELCPRTDKARLPWGHRQEEHGKAECAELLQWLALPWHSLSLQLQRETFTAEILSGSRGRYQIAEGGSSIHFPGQGSTGIFCCSCCFGPWQALVPGGNILFQTGTWPGKERCSQQQQDWKHFRLQQDQQECSQTPNPCECWNNWGQDLVAKGKLLALSYPWGAWDLAAVNIPLWAVLRRQEIREEQRTIMWRFRLCTLKMDLCTTRWGNAQKPAVP